MNAMRDTFVPPVGQPDSTNGLLSAEGLSVKRGARHVLRELQFTVEPGWTAIVGPNGAGKSTLLRAMAGLLPASSGEVRLDGRALGQWTPLERARRLAWLAQGGDATGELTVRETVGLGRLAHLGLGGVPGPEDREAVDEALRVTDCLAWQHERLAALSGGERQRVLLARALATEAPLLLLDEPTTHLDPPHQIALARLMRELSRPGTGTGSLTIPRRVVTVLHDLPIALQADRIAVLDQGRLTAHGPAADPGVHRAIESVFGAAVRIVADAGSPLRVELVIDTPWPATRSTPAVR